MRHSIAIFLLLLLSFIAFSQNNRKLTLDECYTEAMKNFSIERQKYLVDSASLMKVKAINTAYLPGLSLNGQATYQSDVTEIPIETPFFNIPDMYNDMYKATVDVHQMIWDGGVNSASRSGEEVNSEISKKNIDIEFHELKSTINQVYFNLLLLQKSKALLESSEDMLERKLDEMESLQKNGMVLISDVQTLEAEILNIKQQLTKNRAGIEASMATLSVLTGTEINTNTELTLPDLGLENENTQIARPEYQLLDLQQQQMNATDKMISAGSMPKLAAFGQAGYGRPGLNMLSNEFDSFYLVGAKLSWNLWNWNKTRKERQSVELQRKVIAEKKRSFSINIQAGAKKHLAEIRQYEELVETDNKIIQLRESITKTASAKLSNGAITSADYLREVNTETRARINAETNKINLVKAIVEYKILYGNL